MNFLKEIGISDNCLKQLTSTYEESILNNLVLESTNVIEVINYFKEINLTVIESLLLYKIELFTKDLAELKDAFNKFDIKTLVNEINEDITVIDKV